MGSSQSSGAGASFSDPHPRPRCPDIFLAHDDDDDDCLDYLAGAERQLDDICTQAAAELQNVLELMLVDAVEAQSDPSGLELSFSDAGALGCEPGTGLLGLPEGALEATLTAHLPLRAGDDLAYGIGRSLEPLAASLAPFTLTASRAAFSAESSGAPAWLSMEEHMSGTRTASLQDTRRER